MTQIARVKLHLERETKGAVFFTIRAPSGPADIITSIYLRKSGFPTTTYPSTIHVTVESDEDIGS